MNDTNNNNNGGMQSNINDPELAKTLKTVREFSDDLDDPSHRNPNEATPSNQTGSGTNDKGGIDTGSSVGLDTNRAGVSAEDRNPSFDTNNRTGLTSTDQLSVGSGNKVGNNSAGTGANNPTAAGIQQAEGGSVGNDDPNMGN